MDLLQPEPLHTRVFAWQTHLGRCGGDGRCLQAHEVLKMSLKRLALPNIDPGGIVIPSNQLLIEQQQHSRSDESRPGDMYAVARGLRAKVIAMDLTLTSSLSKSSLLHSSNGSNYALRLAENMKFTKNFRSTDPLQLSITKRFIPLVQN